MDKQPPDISPLSSDKDVIAITKNLGELYMAYHAEPTLKLKGVIDMLISRNLLLEAACLDVVLSMITADDEVAMGDLFAYAPKEHSNEQKYVALLNRAKDAGSDNVVPLKRTEPENPHG